MKIIGQFPYRELRVGDDYLSDDFPGAVCRKTPEPDLSGSPDLQALAVEIGNTMVTLVELGKHEARKT